MIAQRRSRQDGVSIIELVIVVAIMLVVFAMAFPTITSTLAMIQTRNAMSELSGIVQNCRSLAVRRSKTKAVHITTQGARTVVFTQNCTTSSCTTDLSKFIPGEDEMLYLPAGATVNSSPPATLQASTVWGSSVSPVDQDITFTPRGLPCDPSSPPCVGPVGFIKYFSYAPSGGRTYWIALTVSPAGRIKLYYWDNAGQGWGD